MHLHRLVFRAIGPFAGEHVVDFDALGASGLFLLEGPTGAGKSTVIDAVVFALFGGVAGQDSSNDRLRSDFAPPEVEPFVALTFSTAAGLFRIRRSPRHQRPKRDGTGTTTANASVLLWRLADPDDVEGDLVSSSLAEAGDEVLRIVGLRRDQFTKTVVLPQGEFAAFLRARAEDRREVLQRLFGTEVYDALQRELEAMRKEAGRQRAAADASVGDALSALAGAAGLSADEQRQLAALRDDDAALSEAVAAVVADTARHERQARGQLARAAAARDEATAGARAAEAREELRLRRARLVEAEAALRLAEPEHLRRGERLALARRAATVRVALAGLTESAVRLGDVTVTAAQALAAVPCGDDEPGPAQLRTASRQLRDSAADLGDVLAVEAGLAARRARAEVDAGVLAELESSRTLVADEQAQLPDREAGLEAERVALVALAATVAARADAHQRAVQRQAAAAERDGLDVSLASARHSHAEAVAAARDATETAARLARQRVEGMAAELAEQLVPGRPCAVCGSSSHPRPARREGPAVTAEAVAGADARRDLATSALEAAAVAVHDLATRRATAAALAGELDAAAADDLVAAAWAELGEAQRAAGRAPEVERELVAVRGRARTLADEHHRLTEQIASAGALLAEARLALTHDEAQVLSARDGHPTVALRVRALVAEADARDVAAAAVEAVHHASAAHDERRREVDAAVSAAGFDSPDEASQADLPDDEVAALEAALREHDRLRAAADAALADPALDGVDPTETVDVDGARTAAALAEQDHDRAQGLHSTAEKTLSHTRERAALVDAALMTRREVAAGTAATIRVADLAAASNSGNTKAMTLSSFVLVRRFQDVVAAANHRLADMSSGRYQLEHSEAKDGARRSGLGLLVRDLRTGRSRDPMTLSGGETFYASLALALGLADVVTAEAGGIDLGTLFVDEGFGSLDPETLDHVLAVLGALRAGGRVVGVVSHVEELKQRIAERVEVRVAEDGSSRLQVTA